MANQDAFKSNKNMVYSCKYHVVWTPKYRRKVLVGGVDERWKEMVDEVADELQCEVLEREGMPDQVDMLCEVDPQFGIDRLVKRVKGRRSRWLRQAFDGLTSVARQKFVTVYDGWPQHFKQLGNCLNKPVTYSCPTVLAACRHAGQRRILWRR